VRLLTLFNVWVYGDGLKDPTLNVGVWQNPFTARFGLTPGIFPGPSICSGVIDVA
jgi:hypothetical protein